MILARSKSPCPWRRLSLLGCPSSFGGKATGHPADRPRPRDVDLEIALLFGKSYTKGRQVSTDGGGAMILSANISAVGDAAGAVLIIVENLPVPADRRVWQEATALHQAGY